MAIKTKADTPRRSSVNINEGTDDWVDAPSEMDTRTVFWDIIGPTGTGRTRLALTAPGPIALINADEKINGIVQPFVRGDWEVDGVKQPPKKVKVATFGFTITPGDKQATLTGAEQVWAKVGRWMADAPNWARTTIFDTGTEGWEICRLANFGELNPKGNRMDRLYGPVNQEFRSVFKRHRGIGKSNLMAIHQVKDKYVDKMKDGQMVSFNTGEQIRAGFKEFVYMADVVVRTGRTMTGGFTATIEKGWYNPLSEGTTVEGDECRFSYIMMLITGLPEEEWL